VENRSIGKRGGGGSGLVSRGKPRALLDRVRGEIELASRRKLDTP